MQPTPDLLEESTYGKEGLTYFQWLEKQLQKRPGAPSVLHGHLGGDRKQAANWGDACAVWWGCPACRALLAAFVFQ